MESSTDEDKYDEQMAERDSKHERQWTSNKCLKQKKRKRKETLYSFSDPKRNIQGNSEMPVKQQTKLTAGFGPAKLKSKMHSADQGHSDSSIDSGDPDSEDNCDDLYNKQDELKSSSIKGDNEISEESKKQMEADQEENEFKNVKTELSNMSFEELLQLKEKLGMKVFNEVMHGKPTRSKKLKKPPKEVKAFKRENKSCPLEVSSKKRVSRIRHVIPTKKKVVCDPRFDERSGQFTEEFFKTSYSFLDDVKDREREKLQKQLNKAKDADSKAKIKSLLNRMNQQQLAEQNKAKKAEKEKEWAKHEKELVSQGKKPFYLKKSDKRKLELAEKYRELKRSGKLEKYLTKKRKKNTQKERRKMVK